jgi:hypothetical protein
MILIPALNAYISAGDFVLAQRSDDVPLPITCLACSVVYPDQLIFTWWLTRVEFSSHGNFQLAPHINRLEVNIPNCAGMSRVFIPVISFTIHIVYLRLIIVTTSPFVMHSLKVTLLIHGTQC